MWRIGNLYERHCGGKSGWLFSVNGEFPEASPGQYQVENGDKILWIYTRDGARTLIRYIGNKQKDERKAGLCGKNRYILRQWRMISETSEI